MHLNSSVLTLALLFAQAPTTVSEATVALQSIQQTAVLLQLPDRDRALVNTEITKSLKAMKKAPTQARCEAAESLIRITQRIGSASYERLQPYLFAAGLVVGPACVAHKQDASGKPIADDQ